MNLATTARDAMPTGGEQHISLKHHHLDEHAHPTSQNLPPELTPGDWIQVTLTDTGGGIPENILPHLFEPFYTTKAPGQGTGLGLSQVYGIIRQHEGYIDVHTEPDKGTIFYLYLPALIAPASESPPLPMEHLLAGQGQVILIVEDNPATRQALVQSLQLLNYRTREAANGREALQILSQQEPNQAAADQVALVLSDVVMPEMGGLALFQTLKERGLRMKVILLTGHPMGKELESLEAQGLSGWLLKPPDIDGLAQAIARALKKP
jgi:CheY-like chemotaxis protein